MRTCTCTIMRAALIADVRARFRCPKELADIITGIFGFDTRPKHKAPHRARLTGASGPGAGNGVAATEFAKRYNFPTEFAGRKLDGSGQCIAIIELGGG